MKKITLSLALMAIAVASCQKSEIAFPVSEQFTATVESFESQTKTSMTPEKYVVWSQNDRLAIFQGSTLADEYKVADASVGSANGTFSIVTDASDINGDFSAGTELPCNVAFYPFADDLSLTGSMLEDEGPVYEIDGFSLPAEQIYAEGSFANGAFPMLAVTETLSDHNLKFKNILGALKLQLKGTQKVTSITVQGKNNEVLSGTATVTAYTDGETKPSITMTGTDAASKSVTLDCGAGVQLNESTVTEFIIALPPVDFTEGFAVTVTDSHGNNQIVETDEENSVLRSSLLIMPPVKLGDSAEQSNVKFSLLIAPDTGTKAGSYSEHVDIVYYEVWDSDWSRKIYPKDDNELAKEVVVGGKATVNLSLASTNTYNIIFWAQNEECGAYDVKDLRRVKIDYSAMSASEDSEEFESFYAVKNFTVYGSVEETIHLKRPLALIYFGEQESDVESPSITDISLTVSNLATVFNTLEGCGEVATEKQVTFVADAQNLSPNGLNGKKYTMNYVFASGTSSQVKAEACFEIDGREEPLVCTLENVAIGKNKRTDILVKWRDSGLECSITLRSNDDTFMDDVIDTK